MSGDCVLCAEIGGACDQHDLSALRAKVESLKAKVSDKTHVAHGMMQQRDEALAEVESLKAQLAEAQAHSDGFRHERDYAKEQLRVAREALEEALTGVVLTIAFLGRDLGTDRMERTANDLIAEAAKLDPKIRAALSASAPKAEKCHETKEECDAATAADHSFFDRLKAFEPTKGIPADLAHNVYGAPKAEIIDRNLRAYRNGLEDGRVAATPVCDDVTLMKVAEAVRNACGDAAIQDYSSRDAIDDAIDRLDLAAIVAEVKRHG